MKRFSPGKLICGIITIILTLSCLLMIAIGISEIRDSASVPSYYLDDIRKESEEKTYILVAHNGIARVMQSYFTDMTNEEYAAWGVKNCAVVRYDF